MAQLKLPAASCRESSLHFESCFSGIQLLVVNEPSPWPVSLITFLEKLLTLSRLTWSAIYV
jgi:hypothetical protein